MVSSAVDASTQKDSQKIDLAVIKPEEPSELVVFLTQIRTKVNDPRIYFFEGTECSPFSAECA